MTSPPMTLGNHARAGRASLIATFAIECRLVVAAT